jgi:hypothetical protein
VKYLLNDYQKNELALLFNIELTEQFTVDLFLNIEFMMEDTFLPDKGSQKSVMKDKIKLLNDVSKAASKLRRLLNRVDAFTLESIDSKLGSKLGKSYEHETIKVGDKAATCWDSISSKDAVNEIENEATFLASDYGKNYKTNATWVLEGLKNSWPYELGVEITLSEHSLFINYLAIVLDENSTDKLVKQCQRSGLFRDVH